MGGYKVLSRLLAAKMASWDHSVNYKMTEIAYTAIKYMTWVKYDGWVLENTNTASSLIILSLG